MMNFRSFKYFLTVCEMGTINAAARKLYISQQSLSKHIQRMEDEVGTKLFYRSNPLILTDAGECVRRAAQDTLSIMQKMDEEIAKCLGVTPNELTIGLLDYGMPEFLPDLIDLFMKKDPNIQLQFDEIMPGRELPSNIQLFISPRELDSLYKSDVILNDSLGVLVADTLLKKVYGAEWKEHRDRLAAGDFTAIAECPFVRHQNTPLQDMQEKAFENNGIKPRYLNVRGSTSALGLMCLNGKAAMIDWIGHSMQEHNNGFIKCYMVPNMPSRIATTYICYRANTTLSIPAQHFLEITRRYFKRRAKNAEKGRAELSALPQSV